MRTLTILTLISGLYFSSLAIAEPSSTTPATSDSTTSLTSQDPNSVEDLGRKMDGCTYLRTNEDLGFDEYSCFDKLLHGINVAEGGKCQSFSLSRDHKKYYCIYNIARGGRNLSLACDTGWYYVGKKGDVRCLVKSESKSQPKKATDEAIPAS